MDDNLDAHHSNFLNRVFIDEDGTTITTELPESAFTGTVVDWAAVFEQWSLDLSRPALRVTKTPKKEKEVAKEETHLDKIEKGILSELETEQRKKVFAEELHQDRLLQIQDLLEKVMPSAFVTVGTTRFDALTNAVLSEPVVQALRDLGIHELKIQYGAATIDPQLFKTVFGKSASTSEDQDGSVAENYHGLCVQIFRYAPSLDEHIKAAKVVIGHAGAGTVLECLRARKPLVVVVNEDLMNNHQVELASKLAELNHLLYCVPKTLETTLRNEKLWSLQPFETPDLSKVARYINRLMGV